MPVAGTAGQGGNWSGVYMQAQAMAELIPPMIERARALPAAVAA